MKVLKYFILVIILFVSSCTKFSFFSPDNITFRKEADTIYVKASVFLWTIRISDYGGNGNDAEYDSVSHSCQASYDWLTLYGSGNSDTLMLIAKENFSNKTRKLYVNAMHGDLGDCLHVKQKKN